MSAKLALAVLESALEPALKPLAVSMALFADDAGTRIFPSVSRLAWCCGISRCSVKKKLTKLRALGVLIPLTPLTGGRGLTVHYRLHLPPTLKRSKWHPTKRVTVVAPFKTEKGEPGLPLLSPERGSLVNERGSLVNERGSLVSEKGLTGEPRSVSDQSVDPPGTKYPALSGGSLGPGPDEPEEPEPARKTFRQLIAETNAPDVAQQFVKQPRRAVSA